MKNRYRKFKRNVKGEKVFYSEDSLTGKQESLRTKDANEANRLLAIKNEAQQMPTINAQIARMYLLAGDPRFAERTWDFVLNTITNQKQGETRERWKRVKCDDALSDLWAKQIVATTSEDLLAVLAKGTVSTNVFLRRLHNYAVAMAWIPAPIIPKKMWPPVEHKEKRAITAEEHKKIIEREKNPERRAFYELCWLIGGSQGDVARLDASCIDSENRTITYWRQKTEKKAKYPARSKFGDSTAAVLESLPKSGPLFPYLRTVRASDRATEFKQRCKSVNVSGVTLHCYRFSWAQRGKECGYPERYAQEALGHNSKAIHRFYSRNADPLLPSLEEYEKKIVPMPQSNRSQVAAG